ncbi:MAG: FMN-binding protein [Spirochaetaceae bacterium]|nr:MAG: FMN-binding protein [Spirochaetaceae bacterium]
MNKQSLGYTIVFSFIVCFAFVLVLSVTHQATRDQVQLNQELRTKRAVLRALTIEFQNDEEVLELFAEIETVTRDGMELFRLTQDGETRYAGIFGGAGLWGPINITLAVDGSVETIIGLDIIDHNETPGLGGRIDERWFQEQFRGLRLVDGGLQLIRDGNTEGEDGKADAITGATGTSMSMDRILNQTLRDLRSALGGEA